MTTRNKSANGRASRAFLLGKISRSEYVDCLLGNMRVDGLGLYILRGFKAYRRIPTPRFEFYRSLKK